jgi:hypothetical protein
LTAATEAVVVAEANTTKAEAVVSEEKKTEEAAPVAENKTTETATKPAPGFESIFAITGLLAVAFLVLGRKE